jgi:hypothetical protein
MIPSASASITAFQTFATWLIWIAIVAFSFRYAKDIIGFVLDKLYQVFIQQNTSI